MMYWCRGLSAGASWFSARGPRYDESFAGLRGAKRELAGPPGARDWSW